MINIRKDLINKELQSDIENGYIYHKQSLSNKFISRLFNHYYCIEMCENFYDSEPDYDDETYNMYMDYKDNLELTGTSFWNIAINLDRIQNENENFRYSKFHHTRRELKEAYNKISKQIEEYEEKRIEFCNWQEPYFKGNWGYSQNKVDNIAKCHLKSFRKIHKKKKDRIYVSDNKDDIHIYLYGRDVIKMDLWFIFKKKN